MYPNVAICRHGDKQCLCWSLSDHVVIVVGQWWGSRCGCVSQGVVALGMMWRCIVVVQGVGYVG